MKFSFKAVDVTAAAVDTEAAAVPTEVAAAVAADTVAAAADTEAPTRPRPLSRLARSNEEHGKKKTQENQQKKSRRSMALKKKFHLHSSTIASINDLLLLPLETCYRIHERTKISPKAKKATHFRSVQSISVYSSYVKASYLKQKRKVR